MPEPDLVMVPAEARGKRLDTWLASLPQTPTRSQITQAIADGRITVDGRRAKAAVRLRGGERVRIEQTRPREPSRVLGEAIDLEILWADEAVVAINKPRGMVVHPAVGNRAGTLVNALLHLFPDASWPGAPDRAGIVHRLDRDTSGVILAARTVRAHEALSRQFRSRAVEKHYLALVHGDVRSAGAIDAPIGRHPRDRKRMSTVARRARCASTFYRPLERYGAATLLEVRPHTGRTHQIRVHLASRGMSVVADPVYGASSQRARATAHRRWGKLADVLESVPRQALHAWRIRFAHPDTSEQIEIEAPLPDDLVTVLRELRRLSRPPPSQSG